MARVLLGHPAVQQPAFSESIKPAHMVAVGASRKLLGEIVNSLQRGAHSSP
jgi:hypothetical protein